MNSTRRTLFLVAAVTGSDVIVVVDYVGIVTTGDSRKS